MMYRLILLLCTGAVLNCCSAQLTNTSDSTHSENLSGYRPKIAPDTVKKVSSSMTASTKVYVEHPIMNVNRKVDGVLDSIGKLNQTRRFMDGFTIQIYSGTNREEALNAKKKMVEMNDLATLLQYDQPKFRVTAGSYFTRLEAQKDFVRIKRFIPNSILVPERVPIR
jgi:hypothetical protein